MKRLPLRWTLITAVGLFAASAAAQDNSFGSADNGGGTPPSSNTQDPTAADAGHASNTASTTSSSDAAANSAGSGQNAANAKSANAVSGSASEAGFSNANADTSLDNSSPNDGNQGLGQSADGSSPAPSTNAPPDDLFGNGANGTAGSAQQQDPTAVPQNVKPAPAETPAAASPTTNAAVAPSGPGEATPTQATPPQATRPAKTAAPSAAAANAPATASAPAEPTAPQGQGEPADAAALMQDMQKGNPAPANASATPRTPAPSSAAQAAPSSTEAAAETPSQPKVNDFAGAPAVPGTRRVMADGEAPDEYAVEPGDTLYDICDQLLDEPDYWPKLWSLNTDIKNPHFIYPGMRLRFYPGDSQTPPYLQVVSEDDVVPVDKGPISAEQLVQEASPPPKLTDTLESSPVDVVGPGDIDVPLEISEGIIDAGNVYKGDDVRLLVPGFIYGSETEPLGTVVAGVNGELLNGPNGRIVVSRTGSLSQGTVYTVLRPAGEVDDPDTGDRIGYRYDYIANVRITGMPDDENAIGEVMEGRAGVQPDDILVSYISTVRTIASLSQIGSLSSADAKIIGGEHECSVMSGAGGFAFLSKGSSGGLSQGETLPVYQKSGAFALPNLKDKLPPDPRFVGILRIIDVTDVGAVGYIMRSSRELHLGDTTGKG